MRVRSEDFVSRPQKWLVRIAAHIEEDWSNVNFFHDAHNVRVGTDHIVTGNPNWVQYGKVQLRFDDEWRQKLLKRKSMR